MKNERLWCIGLTSARIYWYKQKLYDAISDKLKKLTCEIEVKGFNQAENL
jgi:hypothetical protein